MALAAIAGCGCDERYAAAQPTDGRNDMNNRPVKNDGGQANQYYTLSSAASGIEAPLSC